MGRRSRKGIQSVGSTGMNIDGEKTPQTLPSDVRAVVVLPDVAHSTTAKEIGGAVSQNPKGREEGVGSPVASDRLVLMCKAESLEP
eukprot:11620577-Alexandrium_andersonii.AAC.1